MNVDDDDDDDDIVYVVRKNIYVAIGACGFKLCRSSCTYTYITGLH